MSDTPHHEDDRHDHFVNHAPTTRNEQHASMHHDDDPPTSTREPITPAAATRPSYYDSPAYKDEVAHGRFDY